MIRSLPVKGAGGQENTCIYPSIWMHCNVSSATATPHIWLESGRAVGLGYANRLFNCGKGLFMP